MIHRYLQRVSGPLLDRIDIHIEVPRLKHEELLSQKIGESHPPLSGTEWSPAGSRQVERLAGSGIYCNAYMSSRQIKKHCQVSEEVTGLLRQAINQLNLSARAYDRILKLSRTIADLAGADSIQFEHVAEAIQYRSLDRKFWG